MMETIRKTLARFAEHAKKMFDAQPSRRSVLLVISQYWDDQADDEVHGRCYASTRETPVWPHECDGSERYKPLLDGEECNWCGEGGYDAFQMGFYGGYEDAMVVAFEQLCRESANQNMDHNEAYVPFAIARKRGEHVDVEVVGSAQRPPTQLVGNAQLAQDWPDARARALFDDMCLHARDDGPRAVLSDYLLEKHPDDPRGEAIALALAAELDDDTRARRDAPPRRPKIARPFVPRRPSD